MRRRLLVLPKLDVAILTEGAPLDELALLAHDIFDGNLTVTKDTEVVADDVSVAALGAGDQDGAAVVALLRDCVRRPGVAGRAGKGQLVVWLRLLSGELGLLAFAFAVLGSVFWRRRRRWLRDGVCEASDGKLTEDGRCCPRGGLGESEG